MTPQFRLVVSGPMRFVAVAADGPVRLTPNVPKFRDFTRPDHAVAYHHRNRRTGSGHRENVSSRRNRYTSVSGFVRHSSSFSARSQSGFLSGALSIPKKTAGSPRYSRSTVTDARLSSASHRCGHGSGRYARRSSGRRAATIANPLANSSVHAGGRRSRLRAASTGATFTFRSNVTTGTRRDACSRSQMNRRGTDSDFHRPETDPIAHS